MEVRIDYLKPGTFSKSPIPEAMRILSTDLFHGCGYFAQMAKESKNGYDTIVHNTACIFFAVNAMEAKTNELACFLYRTDPSFRSNPLMDKLLDTQAPSSLEDKWNMLASVNTGNPWDNNKEPFCSYELIYAMKTGLLNHEEECNEAKTFLDGNLDKLMLSLLAENISIKGLGLIKGLSDILAFRDLGIWVYLKAIGFEAKSFPLLVGKI